MTYDIAKIFSDNGIVADTGAADALRGAELSDLVKKGPAAVAAYNLPKSERRIGASLGGMFGLDTRDKNEVLAESLKGADLSTVEGINRAAGLIEQTHGGTTALGWKSQMLQRLGENTRENKIAETARMNALTNQQNAVTSQGQLGFQGDQLAQSVAEHLESVRQFNLGEASPNIGEINPSNFTPASLTDYERAHREATALTDPEERREGRIAARKLLRQKPQAGWEYRVKEGAEDEDGNEVYQLWPVGPEAVKANDAVRARNSAGAQTKAASNSVVTKIENMVEDLDSGEVDTGIWGMIKAEVPGTDEFAFKGNLEVILANLGYEGLMSAKNSSETGASGFGQLTQKELELLQRLDEDLKLGLTPTQLKRRLNEVKETFRNKATNAKTDWTLPEYLGLDAVSEADGPETPTVPELSLDAIDAELASRASGGNP